MFVCNIDLQTLRNKQKENRSTLKDKPYRTFDRVIITTGGSLRTANLQYLENLGHKIEATIPALFTFNIAEKAFKTLWEQ